MIRFIQCILFALIISLAVPAQHSSASQSSHLTCTDLRCESLLDPIGLESTTPRLTWIVTSARRDEVQTAYRILVASSREMLEQNRADLWDSGEIQSDDTTHVPYQGTDLRSRQACFWKVMAWDRDGQPGPWSDVAFWEMGLLNPSDWRASWIDASPNAIPVTIISATYCTPDRSIAVDVTDRIEQLIADNQPIEVTNESMGGDPAYGIAKILEVSYTCDGETATAEFPENSTAAIPPRSLPYVRTTFNISRPVRSARVYATALGLYELWLNGSRVGDHRMAPGWTDYRLRLQYQTFDVSNQLKSGRNCIGAIIGPGWFAGRAGLFNARAFYGDNPALLAQLEVTYHDGTTDVFATDQQWMRRDGPMLAADIMDGVIYDARRSEPDWSNPTATTTQSNRAWTNVALREEQRTLHAQSDQPVRVLEELPTQTITQPTPGRWIFDLEQNMVGVARLRVNEPAGTRLTMRFAEMLNPDGTLYTANLRAAAATDTYICRGGGPEEWEARFTFHGFRYVEVTGLTNTPDNNTITGIVIGTDLPPIASFICSDERINQLQSNIIWGLRGNALSIPTDCPQRDERMGWTADMQVFAPTALYNTDFGPFMTKWMRDVRDAQRADGAHSDVAPVMKGLTYGTPVWGDAGTIVPWAVYRFTGDTRILEENIYSMKRWVDWSHKHSTDLIRDSDRGNDYGDWLSIGADTPKDLIGTAYFARSAWIVGQSYKVLGNASLAQHYDELFQSIRTAFIDRYVSDDGTVHGDTQTCYLLALRFNLLNHPQRDAAKKHLVDDLRERGWKLSTGFVGVSHLLPVLDDIDQPDIAYRLLLQDEFPSWLFSIKHGATTIWERWNGWTPDDGMNDPGMNSFNHFALGSCGEWLFSGVAGIRLDRSYPGFSRFHIRPNIDGPLTFARATHRSAHGFIGSAWSLDDDRFTLVVDIPANTKAIVWIPSDEPDAIRESGLTAEEAEGVVFLNHVDGRALFSVGSGHYVFSVPRQTPTKDPHD